MANIIKNTTKKAQAFLEGYKNPIGKTLYDVYESFSSKKWKAYDKCLNKARSTDEYNHDFRITSANTFTFTVMWTGLYNKQEALFVETKSSSYIIILESEVQ